MSENLTKLMKIVNIDGENVHIFRMTGKISMKEDINYNNIESHENLWLHSLFRR